MAIVYKGRPLGETDGVVVRLEDMQLLSAFGEAVRAALLIDCIWFKNGRLMPALSRLSTLPGS
jgi:hypothetical protein